MLNFFASQQPYHLRIGQLPLSSFRVQHFTSKHCGFDGNYQFKISILRESDINLQYLLKYPACLSWKNFLDKTCYRHGFIIRVIDQRQPGILPDTVVLASPLHLFAYTQHDAVYADLSINQLIETICTQAGWQIKRDFRCIFKHTYPKRGYIAQYQETDLAFLQRHCAYWGILYAFVQNEYGAKLVFYDDIQQINADNKPTILPFRFDNALVYDNPYLFDITEHKQVLTKTVRLHDYNPDFPSVSLGMEKTSFHPVPGFGIDFRTYEHYLSRDEGEFILQRRIEALDCQRETFTAHSFCTDLVLGQRVTLIDHPLRYFNGDFHIIGMKHQASLNNKQEQKHEVELTLLRAHIPYRLPAPSMQSMPDCLATITSDQVDEQGRYCILPKFAKCSAKNHYPVRMAQPNAGDNAGFHFPLLAGTEVLISHLHSDPDRPIILGMLPTENFPSPVTSDNPSQHILRTPAGNEWIMEDEQGAPFHQLVTANQTAHLHLNATPGAHYIDWKSTGNTLISANQHLYQQSGGNFIQTVGNNHYVTIQGHYYLQTQTGNISFSSAKDLNLIANEHITLDSQTFQINAGNRIAIEANETIEMTSAQIQLQAPQSETQLIAENVIINAQSQLIISQSGAQICIDSNGIRINAKEVNFNCSQLISPPIQITGSNTSSLTAIENNPILELNYVDNLGNSVDSEQFTGIYTLQNTQTQQTQWAGALQPTMFHQYLDLEQPAILSHPTATIIGVNYQPKTPSTYYHIQTQPQKFTLHCLSDPIYKIIQDQAEYICPLLTPQEIHYFQQRGHNVTLFIHGYNVPSGQFPGSQLHLTHQIINSSGMPCTYARNKTDIVRLLQEQPDNQALTTLLNYDEISNEFDHPVNGTGAHNWLLHIEHNLNCAAVGKYPFPWETDALNYNRILNIHWPGYSAGATIGKTDHLGELNFGGLEVNALRSGIALVPLIQQLQQAGLAINIIAHSLGSLVLIKLLDLLGRQNQAPIDTVIFWQAAISNTALSPRTISEMEKITNQVDTLFANITTNIKSPTIYYSDYLKAAAEQANKIPVTQYYGTDPFSYFPYAIKAAKQFNVLSSKKDEILSRTYAFQDELINIDNSKFIHQAMGIDGIDLTDKQIAPFINNKKIRQKNQKNLLTEHSAMKIPSKSLFDEIYKKWIINEYAGIKIFGRYKIHNGLPDE